MSKSERNMLIVGISGVTCGGKTTTATQLNNVLPNSKVFTQDDYFLSEDDPRHVWIPELNHVNYDILSSLDMEKMYRDILEYIRDHNLKFAGNMVKKDLNEKDRTDIQRSIYKKVQETELEVVIIEGFSIFNYKPMLHLFNLKYYFKLDKEECFRRRCTRVYEPPDCPGYFDLCVWPEYLNQLEDVTNTVTEVVYFNENSENVVERILTDIMRYL